MSLHFYCLPRSLEMKLSFTGQALVPLQTAKRQCFKTIKNLQMWQQSRWFEFLRERLLFLNCSPIIDLKNVPFFSWKCLPSELKKDILLALACHLSVSSLRRCLPHFGWKWWGWRKWALWAVELPWVSVGNGEGKEVGDSAPAQGPDAPSALHHAFLTGRQTLLLWQLRSPGAFFFSTRSSLLAGKAVQPHESLNLKWMF